MSCNLSKPIHSSLIKVKHKKGDLTRVGDEPPRIVYASRIPPRRPRTLRTWLRSPRNFGKTRFGRFATFDFFTPKIFFRKKNSDFFFDFHDFRQIVEDLVNFGRQNQIPRGILLQMVKFSGL